MDKPAHYSAANTYPEDVRLNGRCLITGKVWFLWPGPDGQVFKGIGTAHDIGESGIFIETESIPPLASPLKLVVAFRAECETGVMVRLSGAGYVRHVRLEACRASGFGAWAVFYAAVPSSTQTAHESRLELGEPGRPLLHAYEPGEVL